MFLIFGINSKRKKLDFSQSVQCPCCGRFGTLSVWTVYSCFSLFFIPLVRWNVRYYAQLSCCGATCELARELGRAVARGQPAALDPATLAFEGGFAAHRCPNCGFTTAEDFQFCPKCGGPLA